MNYKYMKRNNMLQRIKVVDYINTTLINDINNVRNTPYLAYFLIASGIEFLGKCMSPIEDWQESGHSQEDFETAICKLTPLQKYKKYTSELKRDDNNHFINPDISLYKDLRCGLLHAMVPTYKILLSSGSNNYVEKDGKLILFLDSFYNEFKAACDEIIHSDAYWTRKDKNSTFLIVNEIDINGMLVQNSGVTQNMG